MMLIRGLPLCRRRPELVSFEAARVSLGALPEAAPPDDVITGTLSLPIAGRGYYGTGDLAVKAFTLNASEDTVAIGDVPNGAEVFLLILEETIPAATFAMTVAGVAVQVAGISVRKLAPLAAAVPNATVTTAVTLSGTREIKGYVLVGQGQEVGGG